MEGSRKVRHTVDAKEIEEVENSNPVDKSGWSEFVNLVSEFENLVSEFENLG